MGVPFTLWTSTELTYMRALKGSVDTSGLLAESWNTRSMPAPDCTLSVWMPSVSSPLYSAPVSVTSPGDGACVAYVLRRVELCSDGGRRYAWAQAAAAFRL